MNYPFKTTNKHFPHKSFVGYRIGIYWPTKAIDETCLWYSGSKPFTAVQQEICLTLLCQDSEQMSGGRFAYKPLHISAMWLSNICRQEPNVMALNEQWVSGAACSQFTDPTLIPCFPNLQLSSLWQCGPRAEKAPWSRQTSHIQRTKLTTPGNGGCIGKIYRPLKHISHYWFLSLLQRCDYLWQTAQVIVSFEMSPSLSFCGFDLDVFFLETY